jgi:hypothetical protein
MAAYTKGFTTNAFQLDTESGKYKMSVPVSEMNLNSGIAIRVSKLLRLNDGKYENTIAAYEVDGDGNLVIYSDSEFSGKLVVTTDR